MIGTVLDQPCTNSKKAFLVVSRVFSLLTIERCMNNLFKFFFCFISFDACMGAQQKGFRCGAIYHVKARYLGSHIFVNLYQRNFYLALETTMQVVFVYLPSSYQEVLKVWMHCHY